MATTTLTFKAQNITVPANTTEHDIEFKNVLQGQYGLAWITMKSGTAVQFSAGGAITSDSITLSASGNNTKEVFEIERGKTLRYKGGAGSETFNINITSR